MSPVYDFLLLQFPDSRELGMGVIDLHAVSAEFKQPPPEWHALADSLLHRPAPLLAVSAVAGGVGAAGGCSASSLAALQSAAGQGARSLPFLKTCVRSDCIVYLIRVSVLLKPGLPHDLNRHTWKHSSLESAMANTIQRNQLQTQVCSRTFKTNFVYAAWVN